MTNPIKQKIDSFVRDYTSIGDFINQRPKSLVRQELIELCRAVVKEITKKEIRDRLLKIEHEQWIAHILEFEKNTFPRHKKWQKMWKRYLELTDKFFSEIKKRADELLGKE